MRGLWNRLLTLEILRRGWHLARLDTRNDFAEDLYSTDVFGSDLGDQLQETLNRLKTGTYQPRPLFRIEVPKGALGFRPGSVIPIHDRVVLCSIVLLLAPGIDKLLPKSVYSWRLKKPIPKTGSIFRESEITDLPFLKKKAIRANVDPFEGWYTLWPRFDQKTRRVFQVEGYSFLATSDISAYFENIQLPILRDQLLRHFPRDAELVNLLIFVLEAWAERTNDGRAHFRGIPQGSSIGSFLGNLFLLPLDSHFSSFCLENRAKYFRYMDDVRVFTKKREDARLAVFSMARVLRQLHLNVQTAKTRIYDEGRGEISRHLIDDRVDVLSETIRKIQSAPKLRTKRTTARYLASLKALAERDVGNGQRILGARTPLEGLSLRAFSRWMTAHSLLGSDLFVERLLTEISRSADDKLTRRLVLTARRFPSKRRIETAVIQMIEDGRILFPYQEAECVRALRYLSAVRV